MDTETHTHTHTHGEHPVRMKAEIRVMLLQAKECHRFANKPLAARREAWNRFSHSSQE